MLTEPRTVGGSLLRASLDEMARQLEAAPGEKNAATSFLAYDAESGVEIGVAVLWHGPRKSEWVISGALSRKVQAAGSPYKVRLELKGTW